MRKNYYPQVIDILFANVEEHALLLDIAKHNPAVLVSAYQRLTTIKKQASWMKDVEMLVGQNRKVEAIKLYRNETGTSLKESKDFCDALEQRLSGAGK